MITPSQSLLVVEDSPEDYEAMVRSFRKFGLSNPVVHCEDGDDALDYLRHEGVYADSEKWPRPAIILLDLNLPATDGREVLAEIKADPDLRKIPVVVLTSSEDEHDVDLCYGQGANSYIQKPVRIEGLMQALERLKDYWFEIVILPKTG